MKKNQVNALFNEETIRRYKIIIFSFVVIALFVTALVLFKGHLKDSKGDLISYNEKTNVDYKVFLKENEFFSNDYLDANNRYIASLIDFINANFKYEISLDEKDVDFSYSYRIEAEVSVRETSGSKPLFNKRYELLNKDNLSSNGQSNVTITENIKIDYNEYNDLIQKFVNIYGLSDTDSTLLINMYVNVKGSCDDFAEDSKNSTVITLSIPLTTKTVGIDIKNNVVESSYKVICNSKKSFITGKLLLSIGLLALDVFLLIGLINYIRTSRTPKTIYDVELRKILNGYHSYIQKVNNKVSITNEKTLLVDGVDIYKACQIFVLNSFTDMLEIRDSLNTPILMSTNDGESETHFIILDAKNKAIYVYELKVME